MNKIDWNKWGKQEENGENKTDAVRERMEFYTMQWPRKSSIKMKLKWLLVSMAIVRNTESTSNTIDFTGKSTRSAWFSVKFATKYLCARTESRRGRKSTSTLIQTPTSHFDIYIFFCWVRLLCTELSSPESSSLLFFWTVSLSWLSHSFINTSLKLAEHAGRPEDVCLDTEISWHSGWGWYVCPKV